MHNKKYRFGKYRKIIAIIAAMNMTVSLALPQTYAAEIPEMETSEINDTNAEDDRSDFDNKTAEIDSVINSEEIEAIRDRIRNELNRDDFGGSGYLEHEIEAEPLSRKTKVALFAESNNIPASYLAIENNQVTSIKNQGNWGACWAFAPIAMAESAYIQMTGAEADMSETHLVNFFYNEDITGPDGGLEGDQVIPFRAKVDNGGNSMYTTFALARWTGAADEKTDESLVYPSVEVTGNTKELNIPQEYAYKDLMHLQNAYWINKTDTDAVKKAIMDYGAIVTSYKHDESCSSDSVDENKYNGPTVYYNDQDYGTSHAIAIVGWDDDFDKNNFQNTAVNQKDIFLEAGISFLPENNGAWLIKNSWGTEYGDEGYFWMSYEEASLSDTMFVFDFENADNYDHIYQYDGAVGVKYESDNVISAAAVYQSTGNQMMEAVGVGVASVDTDYIVEIYTNLTDINNPQSGKLSSKMTGRTTFQGYYTIKLDEYVSLVEGDLFSIVITLSNGMVDGEDGVGIFIDKSYQNGNAVRFVANANPNETFLKTEDGWQDAVGKGTYRIKAYTSDSEFRIPQEKRIITPQMIKEIDDQEYNGTQCEPDIEISYMGESLIKGMDFTVVYLNNSETADKTDTEAPRAIITGIGKYIGTVEQTFTITRKSLTEDMVQSATMIYNGTTQDNLPIKNGDIALIKGADYQITFNKQPCNAGSYTAKVTGINNYTGEISIPVTINKVMISEEMVVMEEQTEYTGAANKPTVKVVIDGLELSSGNFSVSYKNNISTGIASVIITGKTNCQGKVTKIFEIRPKSIATDDITVTAADKTYSGKELLSPVTVKWGKKTLKKGKDYTIVYADNISVADKMDADPPRAIITGVGNYQGTREVSFTILPKEIEESSISVQMSCLDIVESEVGQVHDNGDCIRVFLGKAELDADQYRTVVYNAGTSEPADQSQFAVGAKYDIQITLQGNYRVKGKKLVLKKNIICKKDIGNLDITLKDSGAVYTYNAKAQKPQLTIKDQNGNIIPKTQYTISYVDNTNAGTARAIVKGKGNYAGTKQISFTIQKLQLDNLVVQQVKEQVYVNKELCPMVKVLNGKKALKAGEGRDYTCTYGNNIDVTYENTDVVAGAYIDIKLSDNYEIVARTDGSRNYKIVEGNRLITNFKIVPAKISTISLSDAFYSGQAVFPDKVIVKAGKLEVPPECFEITADRNVNVTSNAQLTATAKSGTNYTGSKTKKYCIVKLELKKLLLPVIPDQPYLGQPVKIDGYVIKQQNGEAIGSDQYDILIKNNKKPGKATATYKAKKDSIYKGSVSIKFKIVNAAVSQAIDYGAAQTIEKQYTGSEITLTDEELRKLAPIKDVLGEYDLPYTVTYSRNVDAGKAVVQLNGKDYLHGSSTMYFDITPRSADNFKIITGARQLSYNNGTPVYLELQEITDGETVLKARKDYTFSYINADKKGTACLAVTGTGNYTGARYIYYNIG